VYKTIEETVGNTPLVQLQRMAAESGNVVLV
jgi:cysteine synthase